MEVASPLPFPHGQGGTKRRFYSPLGTAPTTATDDFCMDDSHDSSFGGHAIKRRRRLSNEKMDAALSSTGAFPAFGSPTFGATSAPGAFSSSPSAKGSCGAVGQSFKRSRTDIQEKVEVSWNQQHAQQKIVDELKRLVDHQGSEIERLTSEKALVGSQCAELKAAHDRALGENKILKKAVTIQQERQNHAASELDAARRYKDEAEERIRRLEQMNLTLQYRLQAQQQCAGSDFMGFGPRPPDVY